MNPDKSFSRKSRFNSFTYAFQGLCQIVKQEPNALIHTIATVAVIAAGFMKGLERGQWIAVCFAIAFVWVTEILNTCAEMLCDLYCNNEYHPKVKIIKDLAAAAVLIAAITAVAVAIIVFTS